MATYGRPDYDAHESTPDLESGEPVFILRARDQLAPHQVKAWAYMALANGVSREMVDSALEQAAKMEAWAKANGGAKLPDMPKGEA